MKNEYSIDIERPRQDVFEFLDDPDNLKLMVPNLIDSGIIQEIPEKVGTTFWHLYEEHGRKMKMTGVVTEHQHPERMAVKLEGAFFRLSAAYRLAELGPHSTRLVQESEAVFKHVFKIMGLLFRKKMEREGLKTQCENFARLKAVLEANDARPRP
jgi:carbon monoxide dehydrogenase subunit G